MNRVASCQRSFTVEDIPQGLCHFWLQHEMPRIGSGAQCEKCDRNSFTDAFSSKECQPCPPGSTAPIGSTSVDDCKCKAGKLYKLNGTWTLSSTWQPFPCCSMLHCPTYLLGPIVVFSKAEGFPCKVCQIKCRLRTTY